MPIMATTMTTDVRFRACRICLEGQNENHISFNADSPWSCLFEYCLGVTVTEPSDAPNIICENCAVKLEEYAQFKKLFYDSQRMWEAMNSAEWKAFDENFEPSECVKDEEEMFLSNNEDSENEYTDDTLGEKITINLNSEGKPFGTGIQIDEKCEINEEFEIDDINKRFYTEAEFLEKFIDLVDGEDQESVTFQCKKCHKQYMHKRALPAHVRKCYQLFGLKVKSYKKKVKLLRPPPFSSPNCGICDFTSFDSIIMKNHLSRHSSNNDLDCRLCSFVGRDFADMISHRFVHQPAPVPKKYCFECGKLSYRSLSLQFHYRLQHLKKKSAGWCQLCDFKTRSLKQFRVHIRCHSEPHFKCDQCGIEFLSRRRLITHLKEHAFRYACVSCGKLFKRITNMKVHIEAIHKPRERISCKICQKIIMGKTNLRNHIRMMHGEKNYSCPTCSKSFSTLKFMKSHMFSHTDDRPYKCKLCDATYRTKCYLKLHLKKHVGDKPFKCTECSKAFFTSELLNRHYSVHTGERKHQCPKCDRTFHEKKHVADHCKKKHDVILM